MKSNHFYAIRKRLAKSPLTLRELRSIEDETLLVMTEEDQVVGNEILACIDEKRNALLTFAPSEDEFIAEEPLAHEFDPQSIESTFSSRMGYIAKMVRKQNSANPYKENLNGMQRREIAQLAGDTLSPEVLAHAINEYTRKLRGQIKIAESLYFGRMKEGLEGLSKLSEKIKGRIEELLWQSPQGDLISALLHSVEEQMGMHENVI